MTPDEDIEKAMSFVAWVINLYGESYWPIFERLEEELRSRKARQLKLQTYLPRQKTRSSKIRRPRIIPQKEFQNPTDL
jgi:hypothetical protein